MFLSINSNLQLELLHMKHCDELFNLAYTNKEYLGEWMPWVEKMKDSRFIENFIAISIQKSNERKEFAFVILLDGKMVGRIGLYSINIEHKLGELGYWIDASHQGKGIVLKSCQRLVQFAFEVLELNRLDIKCGTLNFASQHIPQKLGFKKIEILRSAEIIRNQAHDLFLYSLLKSEWYLLDN